MTWKAVHYINQFFGGVGGEEQADTGFTLREGPVGPGAALQKALGDEVKIVATVICGDNYFSANPESASAELLELLRPYEADVFFAGPAFVAGRYGVACGEACKAVLKAFDIPTISAMNEENPGVDAYRNFAYIARAHNSVAKMAEDTAKMARIALSIKHEDGKGRLVTGDMVGRPDELDYFPRHLVRNEYMPQTAAQRALDMLLSKVAGKPFQSEVVYEELEKVAIPPAVKDLKKARIAVVSDGALCDKDNRFKLSSRGNANWGVYEVDELFGPNTRPDDRTVVHTGYFATLVLADYNRMVPKDMLEEMEREGSIGAFHRRYYCTSGNATVSKWCKATGEGMARQLLAEHVDGVVLTST